MNGEAQVVEKEKSFVPEDEISIKEIILKIGKWRRYLITKWPVILIAVIIGLLAGFFYANHKKLYYIAQCTFVLQDSNSRLPGQFSGLSFLMGGGDGESSGVFQGDNLLELYKSRLMIEKTLLNPYKDVNDSFYLIDRYLKINNVSKQKDPVLSKIRFDSTVLKRSTRAQDSILQQVVADINKNYLNVSKSKSGIVTVEVKSTDEKFSKCFNDQIVKTVNDFYIQTVSQKSIQDVNLLQRQADSIRYVMHHALFSIASSMDANPNANLARRYLQVPSQSKQSDAEANKAILSELIRNLELAKMALRKETPLFQLIDEPVYPLEQQRLSKKLAAIAGGIAGAIIVVIYYSIVLIYKRLIR